MNHEQLIHYRVGRKPKQIETGRDTRTLWVEKGRKISLDLTPEGEFGKDWYTDADEIIILGTITYFIYYENHGRGDSVIFNDNGAVSMWRYGGIYRITPMVKEDLF